MNIQWPRVNIIIIIILYKIKLYNFKFKTVLINENQYDNKYEYTGTLLGSGTFGKVYKMKSIQNTNK